MKEFFKSKPHIFGRYGGIKEVPPNSVVAFKRALERGVDVISTSIFSTKDDILVISKSDAIEVFSGETISIKKMTLEELKKVNHRMDFSWDEQVTLSPKNFEIKTIDEILTFFKDAKFHINIESLTEKHVDVLNELLTKHNGESRIMITATESVKVALQKVFPGLAATLSHMGIVKLYGMYKTGILSFKKNLKTDAIISPEKVGISYIINQGLVKHLKKKGIHVYASIDSFDDQLERLTSIGVDGFITDDVTELKKRLS